MFDNKCKMGALGDYIALFKESYRELRRAELSLEASKVRIRKFFFVV